MDLIEDNLLQEKIKNAINYSLALFSLSEGQEHNEIFKEETYRVIILYAVSCIEAVLLYFYKIRLEKIEILEYKNVELLSKKFQNADNNVIIALQVKIEKKESQIGLNDLVKHFEQHGLMVPNIAKELLSLNNIRNTHHLNKSRDKNCTKLDVESAFNILYYILDKVSKRLSQK